MTVARADGEVEASRSTKIVLEDLSTRIRSAISGEADADAEDEKKAPAADALTRLTLPLVLTSRETTAAARRIDNLK